MCGIVGYHCPNPKPAHKKILLNLIGQSRIRGLHSFGLSFYDGVGYQTFKYHQREFDEITLPDAKQIIFHNRYATSGDYEDHNNNQPLTFYEGSLVFNGVIDMRTKEEMAEHYGLELTTENDGEILLKENEFLPEWMVKWISEEKCSFSGLFLQGHTLYAFRNKNRPQWFLEYDGAVFMASTRDIFRRAMGNVEPTELKPNTLHEWNIY